MAKLLQEITENEIIKLGAVHKGFKHERMKWPDNYLEKMFYEHWKEENKVRSWLNYGYGTLQDLFCWYDSPNSAIFRRVKFKLIINKRDQYIAATVIQWLGTNCGFCFLREVLRKAGYEVVKVDKR